jgi:hypothetical protein
VKMTMTIVEGMAMGHCRCRQSIGRSHTLSSWFRSSYAARRVVASPRMCLCRRGLAVCFGPRQGVAWTVMTESCK